MKPNPSNSPISAEKLVSDGSTYAYYPLTKILGNRLKALPYALRILAENCLQRDGCEDELTSLADRTDCPISFFPSRLILQDMLGLPLLLDIMALREEVERRGGKSRELDLKLPVDLVIDHSMTLMNWSSADALARNQDREFEINKERFQFFKACEQHFESLRVIPPGGGIMHQLNLEYLGQNVEKKPRQNGDIFIGADTVLGTDSHTPMINGLGILGWGIGGLDAESIMFGNPLIMKVPEMVGLEVSGQLSDQVTATDLALRVAEILREAGVVGSFVEMLGSGYESLAVPDRATIANMAPEYGATCVYCPIDRNTIRYLLQTGRHPSHAKLVESWSRVQALWLTDDESKTIEYDRIIKINLDRIGRSVSGPSRPEQRRDLSSAPGIVKRERPEGDPKRVPIANCDFDLGDGDIVIAAITSCTNTANPRNMVTAGLLARNAARKGLKAKPWVKTSLAPGSRVVADYLDRSGLQRAFDHLGFHVAGFACTTCNGMSGPLLPGIEQAIRRNSLNCVAVLSGNRNFAGRIHADAASNILASPPLVVAYALAGSLRTDIANDPLGYSPAGAPVFLSDLWPESSEIDLVLEEFAGPDSYLSVYKGIFDVSTQWSALADTGESFSWQPHSTYITRPLYLDHVADRPEQSLTLSGLRPLAILGDNITTDHISPSGYIPEESAAGRYLLSSSVAIEDFNSYGTRRGCNDVVLRSTFSSLRLRNEMVEGREGPWTRIYPDDKEASLFEAIETYKKRDVPLVIFAGKNYGGGSSRDTAAKAPWLAGIKAVIAESFERIHRSNLINMGIAPLEFEAGTTRKTLNLTGSEVIDLEFNDIHTRAEMKVSGPAAHSERTINLILRLDTEAERTIFRNSGLLPFTLRKALSKKN